MTDFTVQVVKGAIPGTVQVLVRRFNQVVVQLKENRQVVDLGPLLDATFDHRELVRELARLDANYSVHLTETENMAHTIFRLHQENARDHSTTAFLFQQAFRLIRLVIDVKSR